MRTKAISFILSILVFSFGYAAQPSLYNQAAFQAYRVAAQRGDMSAQHNLAVYYAGYGYHTLAVYWYHKAARKGYAFSQFNLAKAYEYGKGISKNPEKSHFWYKQAAKQGLTIANHMLGFDAEQNGNYSEALLRYQDNAQKGYPESALRLGLMYQNGTGVEPDTVVAYQWFKQAADRGHPVARELLKALEVSGMQGID